MWNPSLQVTSCFTLYLLFLSVIHCEVHRYYIKISSLNFAFQKLKKKKKRPTANHSLFFWLATPGVASGYAYFVKQMQQKI